MTFDRKKLPLQLTGAALFLIVFAALWHHFHNYRRLPYEQCVQACTANQGCDLNFSTGQPHTIGSNCLIIQNQCITECGGSTEAFSLPLAKSSSPVLSSTKGAYGAIAFDNISSAWGMSDAMQSVESAAENALKFCAPYGQHCEIVEQFSNLCAAVATGGKNSVAWAKDKNLENAKATALVNCAKKAKSPCMIRHINCYP